MIFAREISDPLTSLVKKIDAETAKNSKAKMGSFIVFLSDKENLGDQLKALAKKESIKSCIFCLDNVAGPDMYNVSKDADVTVILYKKQKVAVNHAYRKGELNDKAIEQIISELPKILPSSK
jgi:hypothetical protein